MKSFDWKKLLIIIGKLAATAVILWISLFAGLYAAIFLPMTGLHPVLVGAVCVLIPATIPLLFVKKKLRYLMIYGIAFGVLLLACTGNWIYHAYDQSLVIDTAPAIYVDDYLPFKEGTQLVELEEESTLKFTETDALPRVDGAAAVFPVYSAFVQEIYPESTMLYGHYDRDKQAFTENPAFQYNNTRGGYASLADQQTDIFFGAYPSQEQIDYATEQGTEFVYTPIGYEAFVFFVHKDNPIENLTTQQIKDIYAGKITNWAQVGGSNEPIAAYQRNEGSGSQSMLLRFMGDTPPAKPPKELVSGGMGGIIETVADYRSKPGSIGFSFRYYVEGIIKNPEIKLISIDGIAPTVENIQNGSYPIITPLYAVTWANNPNENVQKLLDWVLSDQGQYIIEKTGYTPIS